MTITIGFIFLFILVVIPGFIFLRTYYFGDFSKQFTTSENVLNTLLSSMIPGLIIQSFCFLIYQKFIDSKLNLSSVFTLQKEIGSDGFNLSQITKTYLNRYDKFILYSLACYLLACLFGFLISRFIRFSQLDRQIKILRYKNHWYYLFSGEIFHFRKFKDAVEILDKPDLSTEKVIMTKADLLINSGNKNEKYSGYVIDYELDSKDPSKLDSIYLFDAHRYRVTELLEGDANVKTPLLKEKILVPGSVFHLSTRNFLIA